MSVSFSASSLGVAKLVKCEQTRVERAGVHEMIHENFLGVVSYTAYRMVQYLQLTLMTYYDWLACK